MDFGTKILMKSHEKDFTNVSCDHFVLQPIRAGSKCVRKSNGRK